MKRFISLIALVAAFGAPAAFADTVENAIGNRVVLKFPDGGTITLRLKADHTLTQTLPDGSVRSGTWTAKDGKYCHSFAGAEECPPIASGKKVGDAWSTPGPGGDIQISLVAGQ